MTFFRHANISWRSLDKARLKQPLWWVQTHNLLQELVHALLEMPFDRPVVNVLINPARAKSSPGIELDLALDVIAVKE